MEMVNLKINNVPCQAPAGSTVLEAARDLVEDLKLAAEEAAGGTP